MYESSASTDTANTREFIDLQREVIRTIREETMKAQAA